MRGASLLMLSKARSSKRVSKVEARRSFAMAASSALISPRRWGL